MECRKWYIAAAVKINTLRDNRVVVTFKVQRTATPAYLRRHLQPSNCVRNLWSSDCVNLSPKLTSPDVVSVTQLLPYGTHFLEQY